MRNRISCSAQTLRQLEPDMIHAVVGGQVFKLGNQYFAENRVKILETDSMQVSAEVSGTFGVYSQTIKLRAGSLLTKCSCPSNEQPFCRHCVAVLLQNYHAQAAETAKTPKEKVGAAARSGGDGHGPTSSTDLNFREVTAFIDWIQEAVPILGNGGHLPDRPALDPGGVGRWVESIQDLHGRFLHCDRERLDAQRDLAAAEEQIKALRQDLDQSRREANDAHGACVGLQKEIERCQALLADFAAVRKERDHLQDRVKTMREDIQKKCSELDGLTAALQNLTKAIHSIPPPVEPTT